MAMAAIDVAAWDTLAKAHDLPLVKLLVGERDPIPAYASLRAMGLVAEAERMPASSHLYPEVSAHLLAVTPTRDRLEYLDLAGSVLKEPIRIEDGQAVIPTSPRTGVEWDEESVRRYLVD
jgi:mandelate racemase